MSSELGCVACGTGENLKLLRCLHSLCLGCLNRDVSKGPGHGIRCPLCFFVSNELVDDLPDDSYSEAEIRRRSRLSSCRNCDKLDAEVYCEACGHLLCQLCDRAIHAHSIFRDHVRDAIDVSLNNSTAALLSAKLGCLPIAVSCRRHPTHYLTHFCASCQEPLCDGCLHRMHQEHHVTPIAAAFEHLTKVSKTAEEELQKRAADASAAAVTVRENIEQLTRNAEAAEATIRATFDELKASLENRREVLAARVRNVLAEKMNQLTAQLHTIELARNCASRSVVIARALREHRGDFFLPSAARVGAFVAEYADSNRALVIHARPCVDVGLTAVVDEDQLASARAAIDCVGSIEFQEGITQRFAFEHIGDRRGIVYFLGTARGTQLYENPATIGQVVATCSSVGYGSNANLVSDGPADFCTEDVPYSWVAIELPMPAFIDAYVLHHDAYNPQSHFLRSWELQGYNSDASQWETLDKHINTPTLCERTLAAKWDVAAAGCRSQGYRRFRIVMKGPNSQGNHRLMISGWELYGELRG